MDQRELLKDYLTYFTLNGLTAEALELHNWTERDFAVLLGKAKGRATRDDKPLNCIELLDKTGEGRRLSLKLVFYIAGRSRK